MSAKTRQGIIIGATSAALSIILHFAGWINWLEYKTWDWRVNLMARPAEASQNIKLILIDQKSLDWADKNTGLAWPWPRQVYNPILDFCRRGSARAVIFDIIFTETSRIGVSDDELFGDAIKRSGVFVGTLVLGGEKECLETEWPDNIALNRFNAPEIIQNTERLPTASFPIQQVMENAIVLGSVKGIQDEDAIIRRNKPFYVFDNRLVPALGIAAFLASEPDVRLELRNNTIKIGDSIVPIDRKGNAVIKYRGPSQTHKTCSAAAVIQSELRIAAGEKPVLDPSFFKDSYVFIGTSAQGDKDLRPTPISENYPGVEIHATILDNLLANDFIKPFPEFLTVLIAIILAVTTAVTIRHASSALRVSLFAIIFSGIPIITGLVLYTQNLWFPVAVQTTGALLASAIALTVNYAVEGKQKRFIKGAFRQYLSPAVIEQLIQNPDNLKLGGAARELSILFSDVQGFTGISESLSPEQLTSLLNKYLTAMTDIIMEQGGTIDKYEGDAIIAFWNAPLDMADHAARAVRAAIMCGNKLDEMREGLEKEYGRKLYARIGLNTGMVVAGNMGSNQRFNYTFLGDAGNLASRLEGVNKQFGTFIMISEQTKNKAGGEFAYREISRIQVVGRKEPVRVYEPMFKADFESKAVLIQEFSRALQLYYDGEFSKAIEVFSGISSQDATSEIYARRCQHLIDNPPVNWNGIWTMTEK